MTHVRYDLYCQDTPPETDGGYSFPLDGVTGEQLWMAHHMAHTMLNRSPNGWDSFLYKGGPNRLALSVFDFGDAFVELSTERLDPKSLLAIAEIGQALRCVLRPVDGGPELPADAQAMVQDLARRALAALQPESRRLFETTDAAARATSAARTQACAEARAEREAHIKRRKPRNPVNPANPASPANHPASATH